MRPLQHSSGDLIVDRRAGFAAVLAGDKDFGAAAEVMASALELAPRWAAGWLLLGDYRSAAGDSAGAAAAYRQVERLDGDGIFGARTRLAAHGAGTPTAGTDVGYVTTLFDEYAPRFDRELVGDLGYGVPPVLGRMIGDELAGQRVGLAMDLGCGTGLMGAQIRQYCDRLEGIDLSDGMLAEAGRKGFYDRLERAELEAFLRAETRGIELLTAADVVIYCGPLPPVLEAAFNAVASGGLFAFSLELHQGTGTLLQRRQLRYAHNSEEALAESRAAGFEIVAAERHSIRKERGAPVDGLLVLLRRPGAFSGRNSPAADGR